MILVSAHNIRAASWQNQQCGCVPSEDSDQPGQSPSLIRVFAVHMKKAWVLSYPLSAQQRFWSDWADAQADLSLRWAHTHFVGFVMRQLICFCGKLSLNYCPIPTVSVSDLPFLCLWYKHSRPLNDFSLYRRVLHSLVDHNQVVCV